MRHVPLRFPETDREFLSALRSRADAFVARQAAGRFADGRMWAKAAFFQLGYLGAWAALCFAPLAPWQGLLVALLMGVLGTGVALNIGHEAAHGTFARRRWVNSLLCWVSFNSLGTYHHLWRLGHNQTHHPRVNIPGHDVGIEANGALRFAPHTEWKPAHRWQHLYAPFLYAIYTLTWVALRDWRLLARGEMSGARYSVSAWRWLELACVKSLYLAAMLAVPMAYSSFSPGQVVAGFLALHAVMSLYLAAMLFPSHLSDRVEFPQADSTGRLPYSWPRHILATTQDVHPESAFATFWLGGFNAHVAHHFFPQICATHSVELSRIVRETCAEFGLRHHSIGVREAVASHFRHLRAMGRRPARAAAKREAA